MVEVEGGGGGGGVEDEDREEEGEEGGMVTYLLVKAWRGHDQRSQRN